MMKFPNMAKLFAQPLFSLPQDEKQLYLLAAMREVTEHHMANCLPYGRFCQKQNFDPAAMRSLAEIPFLPTSIFKDNLLTSVPGEQVFREIRSSATTSGRPSRMGLDKETNQRQSKCFTKTILDRLGNKRYRFLVLDEPSTLGRSQVVSARASTIRSLLFCAKESQAIMSADEKGNLTLSLEKMEKYLEDNAQYSEEIIIFGFTFVLYKYVVEPLLKRGRSFSLPGAKVLHIGGWKRLESEKVSPEKLTSDCARLFGIDKGEVIDLYGFTEQGGLIYPTCPERRRHVPVWAEVISRDPVTLEPLAPGREGLLQFLTPIQTSYPGHSVITEDVGQVLGIDDCPCGRKGVSFTVTGRALNAEVRGCGDIMAEKLA